MAPAPAVPSPMNEDQVHSFHSGRVSGCVTLQALKAASSTCSRNSPVRMASATSPICTIRVFVIVLLPEEVGRPGGTRTPNMRFWRPPLYHWSYWPSYAPPIRAPPGRRQSRRPPHASRIRDRRRRGRSGRPPSLGLLVVGVLAAPRAELRLDQLVGHGPLVLRRGVVPLLAHVALERDDRPVHRLTLRRLEPTTRIELVTSSLPRTCSTN